MAHTRTIAAGGVLAAAVLAAALAMPAARHLGGSDWPVAVLMFGLPLAVVLAATGWRHYGAGRAVAVAVMVTVVAAVIALVLAALTVAGAMSGASPALAATIGLVVVPALAVLLLGLGALAKLPGHQVDANRDHRMPAGGHTR
jgi:hypothetical protein